MFLRFRHKLLSRYQEKQICVSLKFWNFRFKYFGIYLLTNRNTLIICVSEEAFQIEYIFYIFVAMQLYVIQMCLFSNIRDYSNIFIYKNTNLSQMLYFWYLFQIQMIQYITWWFGVEYKSRKSTPDFCNSWIWLRCANPHTFSFGW